MKSNDLLELQRAVQVAEKANREYLLYKGATMTVESAKEYIDYIIKMNEKSKKDGLLRE